MKERNSLSAYRFVAVMFAQFFVQVFMLSIIRSAGNGDKAAGISKLMIWLALIGTRDVTDYILHHQERIVPKPEQKSTPGRRPGRSGQKPSLVHHAGVNNFGIHHPRHEGRGMYIISTIM